MSFTGVQLGHDTIGYPDLFLAGLLGASIGCDQRQLWAPALVFALTVALDALLVPGGVVPVTAPLAITLIATSARRAKTLASSSVRPGSRTPAAVAAGSIVWPQRDSCA